MTANVNVEINKRTNVLRIPNAALRFRPTNEIYVALGQTPPDPAELRAGADGSGRRERPAANPDAPRGLTGEQPAPADAPRSTRGGRGGGFAQRLEGLSPEERQRMIEQFRSRGGRGGAASGDAQAAKPAPPPAPAAHPSATTFDALFAPLPAVESAGRVWLLEGGQLKPHRVRIGVSDGQNTELLDGDVQEGAELVTNIVVSTPTRPAATSAFPGLGQPQRGGFPGGGFPGGGGGNRGGGGGRGGR
jgi:HlyD family secretion protein